jgi:hypothetical protein
MVRLALTGGAGAYQCRVSASLINDYDRQGYHV